MDKNLNPLIDFLDGYHSKLNLVELADKEFSGIFVWFPKIQNLLNRNPKKAREIFLDVEEKLAKIMEGGPEGLLKVSSENSSSNSGKKSKNLFGVNLFNKLNKQLPIKPDPPIIIILID